MTEKTKEQIRLAIVVVLGVPFAYACCLISLSAVAFAAVALGYHLPPIPSECFLCAGGVVLLLIAAANRMKTGNWL
jgi:hypothetical protein